MEKDYNKILENSKKNSVGLNKKEKLVKSTKKISVALLFSLVSFTSVISLCSCGNTNYSERQEEVVVAYEKDEIKYRMGSEYSIDKLMNVHEYLKKYNIPYELDGSGYDGENNVEDYKRIVELCEEDLIGYYDILGEKESEKVVQALGYEGWDDYLEKNGYIDNFGEPNIDYWQYKVYESFYDRHEREKTK